MIESAKVKVASFSNERFKGDLVVWGFTKSDTSDYLVLNVCLQLRRLNVLDDASNIRIKRWSKATFYFDSSSIIVKNIAFDLALYMDLYWTNALGLCPSYNVEPRHIPALLTSDIKSIQIEAEPETLTFEVSPKYQPALKSALYKLWNKKLPK